MGAGVLPGVVQVGPEDGGIRFCVSCVAPIRPGQQWVKVVGPDFAVGVHVACMTLPLNGGRRVSKLGKARPEDRSMAAELVGIVGELAAHRGRLPGDVLHATVRDLLEDAAEKIAAAVQLLEREE